MLSRRLSTALLTLLAAMLTTAGLTLVLAGPAQAHSELISSTPADGEQSYERPEVVTFEFNEDIQDIGNEIVITGPDGADVVDGDPSVEGPIVTQALVAPEDPGAAVGVYTVTWRVVSSDGHPISGEFTFEVLPTTEGDTVSEEPTTVEPTTEEVTSEASTEAAAPSDADAGRDEESADPGVASPIIVSLIVVAVVAVVVAAVRRRRVR